MTTMAEIEKAVDEFDWATFWLADGVANKRSVDDINKRVEHKREKREHLMQLIERLAQYQPREVSNE
jgi:hypothetical protein